MPNCSRREPHFLARIIYTRSPIAPIWNIFNGVEFLLEKNIIAAKMKENVWVVGILWGFEAFPHGNHYIRVYMHHVCLIQSISARKATHIKFGTYLGSSQCQLHLGAKIVSIGWSGCEWLAAFWMRICTFSRISSVDPLCKIGITTLQTTLHSTS